MDKMLSMTLDNEKLVIVHHNCKTPLDVAKNPEFSLEHAFYTITKGKNHTFTIVNINGSTQSFSFGDDGYTIICESLKALKKRVLDFVESQHVLINNVAPIASIRLWQQSDTQYSIVFTSKNDERQSFVKDMNFEQAVKFAESFVNRRLAWEVRRVENLRYNFIWEAKCDVE